MNTLDSCQELLTLDLSHSLTQFRIVQDKIVPHFQSNLLASHTHTHNRFTAGLEYVRVHPGQQVPER